MNKSIIMRVKTKTEISKYNYKNRTTPNMLIPTNINYNHPYPYHQINNPNIPKVYSPRISQTLIKPKNSSIEPIHYSITLIL
jgi:hypothetical protein